ncbi:hypothetical protein TPENAI_20061 [Tenacibaculum litopenaei]|uniref:hypothetical protein n=1 Tax=Tenacibaculum litopenaei TaxID=396016 RepID=UPI0038948D18
MGIFFKKKKSPIKSEIGGFYETRNDIGLIMKPFRQEEDLNSLSHDKELKQLEKILTIKSKTVRKLPLEIVQQDITNSCEKTLNLIKADLGAIRLVVKQGQSKCKRMIDNFDKKLLIKKYTNEYIQKHSETLQEHKYQLTEFVEIQKAKRHLILENLKQLKHETQDYVFEQCKGETPEKKWYNS